MSDVRVGRRVRRTLNRADGRIDLHIDGGSGWELARGEARRGGGFGIPAQFSDEFEVARFEGLGLGDGAAVLPVSPVSFRDFMLYEKHAVDAARGMVRRFIPAGYPVARAFEAVTRQTFPAFRPNKLWYQQPIYYLSNALTIVPSGTVVESPSYSGALDFELELGVVLGAPLRDASAAEAAAAIAAVVVINDFSARDVQLAEMRSGFGPQKSKHFASSMSETAVEAAGLVERLDELTASVRINGETVSRTGTRGMKFSIAEAIAHASTSEQLYPGELFATGTLPGGSGMEIGRWLAPGDRLRLEIDGIGVIEHDIGESKATA